MCTASDGTLFCSTSSGVCIESTSVAATTSGTAPTIKLIGQAVLGVTEGTSYLACPTPQPTNVICDRQGTHASCDLMLVKAYCSQLIAVLCFHSCDVVPY